MNILPPNISTYGAAIDSLAFLITVVVGVGFVLALGILIYSLIKFRHTPGVKASYILGESWPQLKWVIVPTVILLVLDLFIDASTHGAWKEIKQFVPTPDVTVRVTAQQFSWVFTYPDQNGNFDTPEAFKTSNEMHVPLGKNVVFLLEAKDVLHSFWVPALRLKQDAVPGRMIRGWFQATQTGRYDIGCAQICGTGHTMMHANLTVESPEDFEKWRASKGTIGGAPAGGATEAALSPAEKGAQLVKTKGCTACHSLDGSRLVGPSYKGLFGKTEKVVTGGVERETTVDDAYIMKSIIDPAADVVVSYPNAMPPQRQVVTDEEIGFITAYIKTLK